jgi:hypothetical protein
MPIPVTLITPELTGTGPYPCGIEWTGSDNITRRAVMQTMIASTMQVAVGWIVENQLTDLGGNLVWENASNISTPALMVLNTNYRSLATGAVVPDDEALNEDGTVKTGYISDYMFFVGAFGTKQIPVPFGIYYFIQDAMIRHLNEKNPGLDLVMPV